MRDEIITKALTAYNSVLLSQPEDNRDAVPAMRAALAAMLKAVGEPVAYRFVHLDYAGRKVSRYGSHAERVNGHDPIEVHPLYSLAALREEV